jgi:hypothetical protein
LSRAIRRWAGKKGAPNLLTTDAILEAAALQGGKDGMVGYLSEIAVNHPRAFANS